MNIWALKNPTEKKDVEFVYNSLKQGVSRFGWGYEGKYDLNKLAPIPWPELSKEATECFKKAGFMLNIKPGDWVIHVNVPSYGQCVAAKVVEGYKLDPNNELEDFHHTLGVDQSTIIQFDRNDPNVLPIISSRLKLQGRFWRINYVDDFEKTIANLTHKNVVLSSGQRSEDYHLRSELESFLDDLTAKIQKNNPGGKLEEFVADVLRRVPGVESVEENGKHKGWGSDYGADLIVYYNIGLPLPRLQRQARLVVQVKSYTDTHWNKQAIDQTLLAMEHFEADSGLIITTAQVSEDFKKAFELASEGKNIELLSHKDFGRFVLKFGSSVLF